MLLSSFATVAQQTGKPEAKPSRAATQRPNAAVLYRRAIAELQKAVVDPKTGVGIVPDGDFTKPASIQTDAWAKVVAACAVGLTLFEQGTQMTHCAFDDHPARAELSRENEPDYQSLIMVVRAKAWQLVQTRPSEACLVSMQLLSLANHFATSRTREGAVMRAQADQVAVNVLKAAVAGLTSSDRAIAAQLAERIGTELPKRMRNRDAAAATQAGVERTLRTWFLTKDYDNPAIPPAVKRAAEMTRDMLAPLYRKGTKQMAYVAHAEKALAALEALGEKGERDFGQMLDKGKGDALAAVLVAPLLFEVPYLWTPCDERIRTLETCRQQLQRLAGKKGQAPKETH